MQSLPNTPSLREFARTWQTQMAPQWRRLHRQGVADICDAHLLPHLGDLPLAVIDRARILDLRAHLFAQPGRAGRTLSPSRINKVMTILAQLMAEAAARYGFTSPCDGLRPLRARAPDLQPFSLTEVEQLLAAIRPDHQAYLLTRFFTGLRTGEVNGLTWEHVDFDANVIRVRAIYSAGEHEDGGKNAGAMRDVPMTPRVRTALLDRASNRHAECVYVFHSRHGHPIDAHDFANRIWYPLLDRLALKKRRPYQTRHTAATLMLAAGENPEWIARVLGHANTQMLFTVYSRFVPNLTRRDGSALASMLEAHH